MCYIILFLYFQDLCHEGFSAGRNETNDLVLTPTELPENILSRISKVHFKLKRNLSDPFSPTYIHVIYLFFLLNNLLLIFFIKDHSRNGTFVNGEMIGFNKVRILQNDDIISIAHTKYKGMSNCYIYSKKFINLFFSVFI